MINLLLSGNYLAALMFVVAAVLSIVLHELAHGYAAIKNGDLTPKYYGRMTLNPVKHFDILGFALFLGVGFGWAKPVPVNPSNFNNYRRGMTAVSLAGVTVNFLLAFFMWPIMVVTGTALSMAVSGTSAAVLLLAAYYFAMFMSLLNLSLCVFNLIPIPPLDGFRFLEARMRYNNKFLTFMRNNSLYIFIAFILLLNFSPYNIIWLLRNILSLPIEWFWGLIIK